jgi:hypothetical protein
MPKNGNEGKRKGQFEDFGNYFLLAEQNVVRFPSLLLALCDLCDQAGSNSTCLSVQTVPILPACLFRRFHCSTEYDKCPITICRQLCSSSDAKGIVALFWNSECSLPCSQELNRVPYSRLDRDAFHNFESSFWNDNFNAVFSFTPTFAFSLSLNFYGAHGSVVVKALCYKPEGRGFDSRWGEILNLPNPSSRTRPWGLLSL